MLCSSGLLLILSSASSNFFFPEFQLEVFAFLRNSSEAYCRHPFLALAFKSILKWILFCLFLDLIGHTDGTDVATVWKRIWKRRHLWVVPVLALHRAAMYLRIVQRSPTSVTTISSFEWCGVPALALIPVAQLYVGTSADQRNKNRKMVIEIFLHVS